jgi:poly(A) polymerase
MHKALNAIRRATKETPFEGRIWLVGGGVRDPMLGRPEPNDLDLVTDLDAPKLARLLRKKEVSSIAPVIYPRFGTALVRVAGANVELATTRKESYESSSRKPKVEPASLEEDARRRDFTINALFRNLHTDELYDPLGTGLADLKKRLLRSPLAPKTTFRDDPLRMLRAVRLRWALGFEPAPGLYQAIRAERRRLEIISGERIRDELVKMLALPSSYCCLRDLYDLGLLQIFAPELADTVGVEQGSFHHLDVWNHTLLVLKNAGTSDLTVSLAALLHDVGKPATRTIDEKGRIRFFGHEVAGAEIAEKILRRLKFSNEQILPVKKLIKGHMRLTGLPEFTDAAARRLLRDMGDDLERFLKLIEADSRGLKKGVKRMDLGPVRKKLRKVKKAQPKRGFESPLSGKEIMKIAALAEGPEVGRIKNLLREKVLEGEISARDKSAARELVRKEMRK